MAANRSPLGGLSILNSIHPILASVHLLEKIEEELTGRDLRFGETADWSFFLLRWSVITIAVTVVDGNAL